ncbi:MAG: hypothetical protein IKE65_08240 [Clostridia bacterium]|nr:hypothetical protein [Clostridia bacterium]
MDNLNMTQEQMQKEIERMQREIQEQLEKMTPEERAQAQARAQQAIQDDAVKMQKLLDEGAKIAAGITPAATKKPKFCGNCGAPAGSGKFCEFCGSPLA